MNANTEALLEGDLDDIYGGMMETAAMTDYQSLRVANRSPVTHIYSVAFVCTRAT